MTRVVIFFNLVSWGIPCCY